jgi:hypothetical protein
MNPSPDPLDELLSHPPHLDAPEFTLRVQGALPRRRARARPYVLGGGAVLSSSVAALLLASGNPALGSWFTSLLTGALSRSIGALLPILLLVVVGGAVAASELEEQDR